VSAAPLENLETPAKGDDEANIAAYAQWVDDEAIREARITWKNNSQFTVTAEVREGEALQLQMTHDKGWRATVDGKPVSLRKDVIGNMYLIPRSFGQLEIKFKYGRTLDVWLGYLITFITFGWLIYQFYILRKSMAKKTSKIASRQRRGRQINDCYEK